MTIFYISPTGSGARNGSSANNAGTIYDLPKFISAAGAGDEVWLIADRGAYKVTKQITIAAGGAAGAPVTIRGVNGSGQPMNAAIVGTRAADWKPGLNQGVELFRLVSGADHLKFADLAVKNVGNGVFRIGADLQDLSIARVTATNVTRFVENWVSGSGTSASVDGLVVEDSTISGFSQSAIRLKYNSRNVTLRNIVGDGMRQNGGLVMVGVALQGTVHDVLVDRVTMKNVYGRGTSSQYWNGDGFTAERGAYNLTFRDTVASGNTDGGYDIKSNNVQLIRATASGNNKNFRLWGDQGVWLIDSVSTNPYHFGGSGKPSHFHAGGHSANVTLDNFRYSDSSGKVVVLDLSNGGATVKLLNMPMPDLDRIRFGGDSQVIPANGLAQSSLVENDPVDNGLVLNGTARGDSLSGTAGADVMIGGRGNDTYLVNDSGDRPTEQGGEGTDLVRTTLGSYALGDHLENLQYVGSGSFTGTGNALTNSITGGARNDRLNGGAGNDVLTGRGGADTYAYDRVSSGSVRPTATCWSRCAAPATPTASA